MPAEATVCCVDKGAVLFYLLSYAVTNLGAFGIIALVDTTEWPNDQVRDYAGLWHEHPVLAGLMTVFLVSLGEFPPLAGFIAKWYVFRAAIKAGYYWLAIIGVLTSIVSVFLYLCIVVMMYMTPTESPARFPEVPKIAGAALVVSAILIFYLATWAALSGSSSIMVRKNVAEILTNHVTFELEAIDRMYLNAYVRSLQTGAGFVYFLKTQQEAARQDHAR